MQSLPVRTTGHDFLHSCRHFFQRVNQACTLCMGHAVDIPLAYTVVSAVSFYDNKGGKVGHHHLVVVDDGDSSVSSHQHIVL